MSYTAGERYTASNKFSSLNWTISMIVAFFLCIGIGRLYAVISIINPIIYLNFLLLAGAVILLGIIIMLVKSIGKSRNNLVNITTCLVLCMAAWMAHWAHIRNADNHGGFWGNFFDFFGVLGYVIDFASNRNLAIGRLGRSGMGIDPAILFLCYLVEFAAFMAPFYFILKSKDYYCESCDTEYVTITAYLTDHEILQQHPMEIEMGNLSFLRNSLFYSKLNSLPLNAAEKPGIGEVELHYCKKCNSNAIVNIKAGFLKQDDKQRRQMSQVDSLTEDTYITDESRQLLSIKIGLAHS